MSDLNRLFGIAITEWVLRTSAKMKGVPSSEARSKWVTAWRETYRELGGRRPSCGDKGCPRSAAYGLWNMGRLRRSGRSRLDWPISQVVAELGRNAAYAVIAADLCLENFERSLQEAWPEVRREFLRHTTEEAAHHEQGQVRIALVLARAALLT